MSPAAATTGAGAREEGLAEPLLVNGGGGGVHAVANGSGHGPATEKKESAEDKYWVDIDQPEAMEPLDVESGVGGRPLLFWNKRVKRYILYPYRLQVGRVADSPQATKLAAKLMCGLCGNPLPASSRGNEALRSWWA